MNIIVADGYAVNPGDISWDSIASLGKLTVHDRTAPNELIERCKNADIILTNKVVINKEAFEQLPSLKMISVLATGYNVIDIKTAKEKNIPVCNVPGYGTASVAQHAFALLLELTNRVGLHATSVASGEWNTTTGWSYFKAPLMELAGKTMGIVGFGNIGQQTATIAAAFGMNVLYYGPNKKETTLAKYVELNTLFAESDVISLHCPQTNNNLQFVNKALLVKMKPSAFLINTSRGPLIQEQDLADALNEQKIAGAGLDVLSVEPPPTSNPLLSAKNCIITPHNAWMSKEARQRVLDVTANNIKAFLSGKPVNVVAKP